MLYCKRNQENLIVEQEDEERGKMCPRQKEFSEVREMKVYNYLMQLAVINSTMGVMYNEYLLDLMRKSKLNKIGK